MATLITPTMVKGEGDRYEWPFSIMEVGTSLQFEDDDLRRRAQYYIHTFARQRGLKFRTSTKDKVLTITRIS